MYKDGELNMVLPHKFDDGEAGEHYCQTCPGESGHNQDGEPGVYDSANGNELHKAPVMYLNHSCGPWVIGGPNEVRSLIGDLTRALAKMEA